MRRINLTQCRPPHVNIVNRKKYPVKIDDRIAQYFHNDNREASENEAMELEIQ